MCRSIESFAQEPPGPRRDQAMSDARRALNDTQQAMLRLPPEYRVSGRVVSSAPITRVNPAQNRTFGDSMKELQLAADRLCGAIQAMADQPAGPRRNDAIKQAHEALLQTQQAMAWVPGYPATASSGTQGSSAGHASARARAQGTVSTQPGSGSVSGAGIAAGSDLSEIQATVPAVAGGVALNARAMLSSEAAPDHNVRMVFSLNTGNYLASVHVKVRDKSGRTIIDGLWVGVGFEERLILGERADLGAGLGEFGCGGGCIGGAALEGTLERRVGEALRFQQPCADCLDVGACIGAREAREAE